MIGAVAGGQGLSGLDYMRALRDGALAPPGIGELMDFTLLDVDEGYALFRGEPGEQHMNPIGSVHGGFAATLLDSALGCAVHTTLLAGIGYTTLELSVNFVRGITPATGPVLAEARVIHVGRRTATAEAQLRAEHGNDLLAHGKTTCLILR